MLLSLIFLIFQKNKKGRNNNVTYKLCKLNKEVLLVPGT